MDTIFSYEKFSMKTGEWEVKQFTEEEIGKCGIYIEDKKIIKVKEELINKGFSFLLRKHKEKKVDYCGDDVPVVYQAVVYTEYYTKDNVTVKIVYEKDDIQYYVCAVNNK